MDKQRKEKKDKKEKEKSYIQGFQKGRLLLQTAAHSPKVLIPTFKNRDVPFWKRDVQSRKRDVPDTRKGRSPGTLPENDSEIPKGTGFRDAISEKGHKKGTDREP